MAFYVEPGGRFNITYLSDGQEINFPIPDVEANTEMVALFVNGIAQDPVVAYTVHQGTLTLRQGPFAPGLKLLIRNS